MIINPAIFRAWILNAPDEDAVVRSIISHQCRNTGADLYSEALDASVQDALTSTMTTRDLAKMVLDGIRPQIKGEGYSGVSAPRIGAPKWEPWFDWGWMQGGLSPAAAIIAAYAGDLTTGERIVQWIEEQQGREVSLTIPGLWHAGERRAWMVTPGQTPWTGQWRYAGSYQYPAEDATQIAAACCLHAFGKIKAFNTTITALRTVLAANNGAMPYNIDARTLGPTRGRGIAPQAYSTEETTHAVLLLEAAYGPTLDTMRAISWLRSTELPGGGFGKERRSKRWPKFIDRDGAIVYPRCSLSNPRNAISDMGELTSQPGEAVEGFAGTTERPMMIRSIW